MIVEIPATYEKFIQQRIESGRFSDAQAAVVEALSALQREEEDEPQLTIEQMEANLGHEWLKKEIAIGLDEADRGLVAPLDIEEIKAEGRRLLAESPMRRE
jgi:Arc/MetJ-type ribon-helix-helix transcriptional regulator